MSIELTKKGDFMVSMDRLNAYEEFAKFSHGEKEQIVSFIQYAYHIDSPYVRQYESLNDRFSTIARDCPIEDSRVFAILAMNGTKEDNDEAIQNDLLLQSYIDDMISCYLSRIQNNYKFELYITYQLLFSEYCHRLRSKVPFNIDEDKALKAMETKVKITQPCEDLIKVIDRYRKDIFGDNSRHADIADKKVARVRPEDYAKMAKR